MTRYYSLGGEVGWVNLSNSKVCTEPTHNYREFMGGRGVGSWLVFREVPIDADPLSEENIITFNTGPLTGTLAPSSGRLNISTKNLITNGISFSNAGGHFAPALKRTGFDHLVVRGRAREPVYLYVHEGKIEIRNATHLWGKDAWETDELIKEELNDPDVHVAAIGQAGENLVKMACVIVDKGRAAAWGGSGAVMGSKRLKAIAVGGKGNVRLYATQPFIKAVENIMQRMDGAQGIKGMRRAGSLCKAGGGIDGSGPQAVRNMEDEVWSPEKTLKIRENVFRELYEIKRLACFACPIHCSHYYRVRESPWGIFELEGIEANNVRGFGSNLDVTSVVHILKANEMSNRYGLNIDEASATIAWAIEMYEKGLIDNESTGGLELKWGNGDVVIDLLRKIALREGFGNLLAEGVYRAAQRIGRGTEKYAVQVKRAGINENFVRSHKAWALGIMTSVRGGGHLGGSPQTEQKRLCEDVSRSLFGVSTAGNPTTYAEKGELVYWFEKYKAIVDMLGVCVFTSLWCDPDLLTACDYAELTKFATGWALSGKELMLIGERVCNIEKAFNTLHAGFTRDDDYPPRKLMEVPVSNGEFAGEILHRQQWSTMLDDYYEAHGWDVASGWQRRSTLRNLGLEEVEKKLAENRKLIID